MVVMRKMSRLVLSLIVLLILNNPSYSEDEELGPPGVPTPEDENLLPSASINVTATTGNAPFTVQFTGNGFDDDGSIVGYFWDFGDGTTLERQTVIHTYETAGTYVVMLTVTDDLGAKGTVNVSLVVTTNYWNIADMEIDLGEGWGMDVNRYISCLGGRDGGITSITLPNPVNGIYDLWFKVFRSPLYKGDPCSKFAIDGEIYDFVPAEGESTGPWVKIKTIRVVDNNYSFQIDDLSDAGIFLYNIKLEPPDEAPAQAIILTNTTSGAVPLDIQFTAESKSQNIISYFWDFGDGATSNQQNPLHIYQTMGRYTVELMVTDNLGATGMADVVITATPSRSDLKGVSDVEAFGFWVALLHYGVGAEKNPYNLRRMDELQALHVNFIEESFKPHFYNTEEKQKSYHRLLEGLHARGIQIAVKFTTDPKDWFSNDDSTIPMNQWIFDTSEAEAKFQSSDRDGDGISDLDGRIDVVYLAHEVYEFANYEERVQMYQLAKRYFPTTPIMMYYGGGFAYAYARAGYSHPAGGMWEDYQYGPGETDIICFYVSPPFIQDAQGNRQLDPRQTIKSLLNQKQYADPITPEIPIWVLTTIGSNNPSAMWEPEEILDWAAAILSVGDVQGILARGYGRLKYDLDYGTNTADPSQPESGFIEQRKAFRTIGKWIQEVNPQ